MIKIRFFHHYSVAKLFLIMIFLVSGCTHMQNQPLHEISISPIKDKVNLSVGLVITSEFHNAKIQRKHMGDTWVTPIGENLVHHSERLIKSVFTHSVIFDEGASIHQNSTVKYIMKPKLVLAEQAFGVWADGEAKTSIGVEWNLSDISGKAVWVETVKGVGIGKPGNTFTGEDHNKKNIKLTLQDLFEKTQNAILSSRLLRSLK